MKNFFLFAALLTISLNFTSCRSTRDMKYFQDLYNDVQQQGVPARAPEYLIKSDDNLYVDVSSMNSEVNQLFSPSKSLNGNNGTAYEFGQQSSQYLNGYQVDLNGMILLPVIGEVKVVGLTEEAAKNAVQKRVDEYFKDTTVKVKILTYKVTVLGEVRNPGVYYNYNKSITILEALGLASGTTDFASVRKVLVIRSLPNGSRSFRVDLTEKQAMASEAFYLLPNDVLYVEPDKYKNFSLNTTVYSMSIAAITTALLVLSYMNKY